MCVVGRGLFTLPAMFSLNSCRRGLRNAVQISSQDPPKGCGEQAVCAIPEAVWELGNLTIWASALTAAVLP
ncbi:UNVERIFIED_CONTAM: hypothetical protein K2H54_002792 [Gekko kuhli]